MELSTSDDLLLVALQFQKEGNDELALSTTEIILSKDKENINANLLFVDLATKRKNLRISEEKMYFLQKMFIARKLDDRQKEMFKRVHKEYMTLMNNDDTFMFDKL